MGKKKVKRQWIFRDMKIVLSDPKIQAFESDVYLRDVKGMYHYYYDLDVYVKDKKQWKLLFRTFVYDFPCIQHLPQLIDGLSVEHPYFSTESFACEDYYSISRVEGLYEGDKYLWYDLTIGVGQEQGKTHDYLHCVKLLGLSEEDLLSFKRFIQKFLEDSLAVFNHQQTESIQMNRNRYFVDGEKLYERGDTACSLYALYHKGQTLDIIVLYENTEDRYQSVQIEYQGAHLLDVKSDAILITFGSCDVWNLIPVGTVINKNQVWIPVCQIQHVFDYVDEPCEIFKYDKHQCYAYIKSVFTKSELADFGRHAVDWNQMRWKEVFANLVQVYREEHGFQHPKRVVRWMIKKLTLEMQKQNLEDLVDEKYHT